MAKLCRIVTAAILVVHLIVGCCAHHAHACDGHGHSPSARGDATSGGRCPESGGDHSRHGPKDCQGAKCSFVSPSRTVSDSFVPPLQASCARLLDDPASPLGVGSEQHSRATGRLLLPVRLHLANQVLLI